MSEVKEPESRIEQLSSDIVRQKEILRNLERDKGLLQRQLNTIRDPVTRLPLGISSQNFLQCLPLYPKLGASHIVFLLSKICNSWADIVASTSALWASIHIDLPRRRVLVKRWLEHAGHTPLHIFLTGWVDPDIISLIWKRWSEQLEHLELSFMEDDETQDSESSSRMNGQLLEGTEDPPPLPSLKTLAISSEVGCDWAQLIDLLRDCPNITELVLEPSYATEEEESRDMVILPNLRLPLRENRHFG